MGKVLESLDLLLAQIGQSGTAQDTGATSPGGEGQTTKGPPFGKRTAVGGAVVGGAAGQERQNRTAEQQRHETERRAMEAAKAQAPQTAMGQAAAQQAAQQAARDATKRAAQDQAGTVKASTQGAGSRLGTRVATSLLSSAGSTLLAQSLVRDTSPTNIPPPTTQPSLHAANAREAQLRRRARGRASTILTTPLGVTSKPNVAARTLLG